MIRFANSNDKYHIFNLTRLCFPGEDEFFNWYDNNIFDEKNCIVYTINDKIVAVLQRIYYEIQGLGKCTYLFGICTHPAFRKKGILGKLLAYSHGYDYAKNIKASFLVPQTKELFELYKRYGYSPISDLYFSEISINDLSDDNYLSLYPCSERDIIGIKSLYDNEVKQFKHVIRDKRFFEIQISMFRQLGGDVFVLLQNQNVLGYAFVWNDDKVFIQEICAENDMYRQILIRKIMQRYKINKIKISEFKGSYEMHKIASIYSKNEINLDDFKINLLFN